MHVAKTATQPFSYHLCCAACAAVFHGLRSYAKTVPAVDHYYFKWFRRTHRLYRSVFSEVSAQHNTKLSRRLSTLYCPLAATNVLVLMSGFSLCATFF